jgi:hypothetical protein
MRQPTIVRRRLIGRTLRAYRANLAYDLGVAAAILNCDRSKMSRIETGERGIRADELLHLLEAYGVSEAEQDILLAIVESTRSDSEAWWQDYPAILTGAHIEYLATEPYASHILTYGPVVIPELLQTQDYARAAAQSSPDVTAQAIRARQAEILDETTVSLAAIIGESALRQPVGGTAVMREQLRSLADAAGGAWTTIQMLADASGAPVVGGTGSFSVLQFSANFTLGLVYLDGPRGGLCLDDPVDCAAYAEAFTRMQAAALSPQASLDLIRQLAEG